MGGREDLRGAALPVAVERLAIKGGEPLRTSCETSSTKRYPGCRDFVAKPASNSGGAVPSLAIARSRRAKRPEEISPSGLALCNPFGIHRLPGISPSVQLVRCQRISRLCVLMNPILPGARSIRTWPAKYFTKTTSAGRTFPADAEAKPASPSQLTNLRMRTFIAAPSARNVNNTEDPP